LYLFTVGFCPAGSQPTSDQSACEKCPVGMYQPLDNQAACFPCPEGTVTSQLGSTSSSSCMGEWQCNAL